MNDTRILGKASLSRNNFSKLVMDSDWPKEVSGQRWHHLFFCYAPLLWLSTTIAKCLVHFNPSYIFEWPRLLGFFKLSLKLVGVARLYTSYRSNIESSCLVGLPQTRSWRQPPKWPPKRTNVNVQVVERKFIKLRLIWQVPVLGYVYVVLFFSDWVST